MNEYTVYLSGMASVSVRVNAEDQESAIDLAYDATVELANRYYQGPARLDLPTDTACWQLDEIEGPPDE